MTSLKNLTASIFFRSDEPERTQLPRRPVLQVWPPCDPQPMPHTRQLPSLACERLHDGPQLVPGPRSAIKHLQSTIHSNTIGRYSCLMVLSTFAATNDDTSKLAFAVQVSRLFDRLLRRVAALDA